MKLKRQSFQHGCVAADNRRGVWVFRWREAGHLKNKTIGSLKKLTKSQARVRAAMLASHSPVTLAPADVPLSLVAQRYVTEVLPELKFSTRSAYQYNLDNHILPQWGDIPVLDIRAMAVHNWMKTLHVSAKTKVHLRGLLSILISQAMFWELIPTAENPMRLVKIKGASKREAEPAILTTRQFQNLLAHMEKEPYRTMVLIAMCFGLRVSELLGLKWKDVDWKALKLKIERGIVRNRVDDVKTRYSRKPMPIDPWLASLLKRWKAQSEFAKPDDWIWASPYMAGESPYFYSTLLEEIRNAANKAGLEAIGWHTLRHTFRSWMDETGAHTGVQQRLMRHADIRTTFNQYGDAIPETLRKTHSKVVKMARRTA